MLLCHFKRLAQNQEQGLEKCDDSVLDESLVFFFKIP